MVGSLSAGGAERVALELAAGLKEKGWRTELLALAGREGANPYAEPLRAEAAARGVLVRRLSLPGIRSGPERGRVLQFLGDQDVSLVHAHNRPGDWQMTLLGRLAGVPVVYSRHLPYAGLSREQRIAYFLSARSAARVVAISKTVEEHLLKIERTPRKKIARIPNGIDTARFRPPVGGEREEERNKLGLSPEDFAWLSAARLAPQKGLSFLVEAFRLLPQDSRSLLLLAGEGPEMENLRTRAGDSKRIRFLGVRADVERLLRAADGYACASLAEGHPLSLLEALAAQVPVVAPRLPSIEEVAAGSFPRFFGPSLGPWAEGHDPKEIAAALGEIERSPGAARGAETRRHVEAHYSLAQMVDAHERLYREVLGR